MRADWRRLAMTHAFAIAVDANDRSWGWGTNYEGEIVNTTAQTILSPTPAPLWDDHPIMAAGDGHGCVIRGDRSLWCWGRNNDGVLGNGSATPAQVRTPGQVQAPSRWLDVSAGNFHTCAIRDDQSLWCFGSNTQYQIGNGTNIAQPSPVRIAGTSTDWAQVSARFFHTCGVRTDHSLWCWGRNIEGQIGTGAASSEERVPVQVGTTKDWSYVAAGDFHTCALKMDGTVWCTGKNDLGQLGLGTTARRPDFAKVNIP